MGIGVSGLMSGLDTEAIIGQMMSIERRPILQLQAKEAAYQAQISAFGALKAALSSLQSATAGLADADTFDQYEAASGNADVLAVSISDSASLGEYQVEVTQLAQSQQVRSTGFTASDEVVGTGTLTIQVGSGEAIEVEIDSDHNTLAGIATAINEAETDVTARVIYDGSDYYLALGSNETGLDNTIAFTLEDDDGNNDDASGLSNLYATPATHEMSETQAAANATLELNGIAVWRAGNTIDDLIEGVTLTLQQADAGNPFTVTVSRDLSGAADKLDSFVSKYNKLVDLLKELQAYDAETGVAGTLKGDGLTRQIENQLRGFLYTQVDGVDGEVNGLSQLGVEVNENGKLSFDESVFTAALEEHREEVSNFFVQETDGNEGWAVRLDALLDDYLSSSGLLEAKEKGLQSSIDRIGDQVERIEFRLAKREENLRRQFEVLETLMAQFQSTAAALDQQLQSISNLSASISKMRK